MAVVNTLAYYDTEKISIVKSFIMQESRINLPLFVILPGAMTFRRMTLGKPTHRRMLTPH